MKTVGLRRHFVQIQMCYRGAIVETKQRNGAGEEGIECGDSSWEAAGAVWGRSRQGGCECIPPVPPGLLDPCPLAWG